MARAPQPLFWVFGRGEALLAGMAALAAGSGLAHPAPALGALLVAEGGWQALRWLALEAP
ncbi:MAG: EamA family transporter, partial [Thermoflexus sp.]